MTAIFKKVVMVPNQSAIAQVNRKTGTLYLSDSIWKGLPSEEKKFVLFHEEGHLRLQTANEFSANSYAVGKFLSPRTFTNKELGQKIMVMRSILDKADGQISPLTSDLGDSIGGGILTPIFDGLQVLGIGSKSRQAEAEATAAANIDILNAQSEATAAKNKSITTILLVAGGLIIMGLIIYFTLRRKK